MDKNTILIIVVAIVALLIVYKQEIVGWVNPSEGGGGINKREPALIAEEAMRLYANNFADVLADLQTRTYKTNAEFQKEALAGSTQARVSAFKEFDAFMNAQIGEDRYDEKMKDMLLSEYEKGFRKVANE